MTRTRHIVHGRANTSGNRAYSARTPSLTSVGFRTTSGITIANTTAAETMVMIREPRPGGAGAGSGVSRSSSGVGAMVCYRFRTMKMLTAAIVAWLAASAAAGQNSAGTNPIVVFDTAKGAIEIEVDPVHAPLTAANFLKYVDGKFYDGGTINRAVRPDNTTRHDVEIQVIQFQMDRARRGEQFPPVPLERTNATGLTHVNGALSMARAGPDTATASFSIVIGDQPEMDFGGKRNPDGQGFAVFGRVVKGMDVVKAIQSSPTGQRGAYGSETLDPPIAIVKAYRR